MFNKDKKIILVVDDVALNLTTIKSLLSHVYDIRAAKSGKLALYILGSVKVDLILLDIEMPGMSGFELAETIKEIPEIADTPIIFVTTHATADFVDKANKVGAVGYVVKPINSKKLYEKIEDALQHKAAPGEIFIDWESRSNND